MKKQSFLIKEALSYGLNIIANHFGKLIAAAVITALASTSFDVLAKYYPEHKIILKAFSLLISTFLGVGMLRMYLDIYENKPPLISSLITNYHLFFKYLGANLLYVTMVFFGSLLLVVPGIYCLIKYQFAFLIVVDKKLSPTKALELSGKITHGVKWKILLFDLVAIGVLLLGLIVFLVGIIFSGIIVMGANTHVYKQLLNQYENSDNPDFIEEQVSETALV